MSTQPPCPNREKMVDVSEESNMIGAFLAWMINVRGLSICEWLNYEEDAICGWCGEEGGYFVAVTSSSESISRLLAEYYDIDYDEMDRELKRLLAWLREQHEEEGL